MVYHRTLKGDTFMNKVQVRYEYTLGTDSLEHKRIEETFAYDTTTQKGKTAKRLVNTSVKTVATYKLLPITKEEIIKLRISKTPFFLLKKDGEFYSADITHNVKLVNEKLIGAHLCGECGNFCNCEKVLGYSCFGLERFQFVTTGYEAFNVKQPICAVIQCDDFVVPPPREKLSVAKRDAIRLKFAQNVFPEAKSMFEVRALVNKNKGWNETSPYSCGDEEKK